MSVDQSIVTDLLGATVEHPYVGGGGKDTGTVRAVYLSPNGMPMLLVADSSGRLSRVSYDSARVLRGR